MSQQRVKHARAYFRRDGKQVIVVTVHQGPNGAFVEADGPLSLTRWDDEALGEGLQTALGHSAQTSKVASGTPGAATLKASGEPSPRAFDAGFIALSLLAGDPDGSILVQGRPEPGLTLSGRIPPLAAAPEFARQATRIFQICRDRKF